MMLFLHGALAMACVVSGSFFFKFWKTSRDRFFLFFALAFWLFTLNWIALAVGHPTIENRHFFYLTRLPTFLVIAWAIIDKNRRGGG